jgi:hypothetical protein
MLQLVLLQCELDYIMNYFLSDANILGGLVLRPLPLARRVCRRPQLSTTSILLRRPDWTKFGTLVLRYISLCILFILNHKSANGYCFTIGPYRQW